MTPRTALLALGLCSCPCALSAQGLGTIRVAGDTLLRASLSAETRVLYEQARDWSYYLLSDGPLGPPAEGPGELSGARVDGSWARVVAAAWTREGRYAVECYQRADTLLLVYETMEYFEGAAPAPVTRNFRGLPAWERRSYFDAERIGYAEARGSGAPAPGGDGEVLRARCRGLAERLGSEEGRRDADP